MITYLFTDRALGVGGNFVSSSRRYKEMAEVNLSWRYSAALYANNVELPTPDLYSDFQGCGHIFDAVVCEFTLKIFTPLIARDRRVPTVVARLCVHVRWSRSVKSCAVMWDLWWKTCHRAGYLPVLRFPLPILIPSTAPQFTFLLRGFSPQAKIFYKVEHTVLRKRSIYVLGWRGRHLVCWVP
jgi:hypothetical protein